MLARGLRLVLSQHRIYAHEEGYGQREDTAERERHPGGEDAWCDAEEHRCQRDGNTSDHAERGHDSAKLCAALPMLSRLRSRIRHQERLSAPTNQRRKVSRKNANLLITAFLGLTAFRIGQWLHQYTKSMICCVGDGAPATSIPPTI